MNTVNCQIISLTSLTPHVYKVLLKPSQKVDFIPGQYLNFIMSDKDKRHSFHLLKQLFRSSTLLE